jgi:hypothetical protein
MNNFFALASNHLYKFTEKNITYKFGSGSGSTKKNNVEDVKPEAMVVRKITTGPYNNFTALQKKIFMTESIRKAEEFAKKQSVCYCYNHSKLFIKPSWCYKCNKIRTIINNALYPTLALNGTLNSIDFAILGLVGIGCISYIFYWKR